MMNGADGPGASDFLEAFLGFLNVEQVRAKLQEFDNDLRNDINTIEKTEYVAAVAALDHFEPSAYVGLARGFKGKYSRLDRWERAVRECGYRERARIGEAKQAAQAQAKAQAKADSAPRFVEVKPATHPVPDGALLLTKVRDFIRRFVRISEMQAVAITLWIAGVYAFSIADLYPRLTILSVKKRCGKSRLETVIAMLAPRVLRSSNVSTAVLFRLISADDGPPPTVLLDEADSSIFARRGATSERTETLRGLINAGYEKATAYIDRCEAVGNQQVTKRFHVWAPMVLAAIGRAPDTVEDRSIIITMVRRLKTEKVEKLTRRNQKIVALEANKLAGELARWVGDNLDYLAKAEPKFPAGLDDRAEDLWDLMLSVADLAGRVWATAARKAAQELCGHRNDDAEDSFDVRLLADIGIVLDRGVYGDVGAIGSTELCDALRGLEDSPWASFGKTAKPLSTRMLSLLLRTFGVYPSHQHKGSEYDVASLRDVISRYVPEDPPSSVNVSQPLGGEGESEEIEVSPEPVGDGCKSADSTTERRTSDTLTDNEGFPAMGAEKSTLDEEVF